MPRISWASLPLAVLALTSAAVGSDFGYGWGTTSASCGQCYTYGAPACGAPFFGWQPGCCQDPPSPCDNAWAGYCEEKARWKAFCYRLGTGGKASCGSMPGSCQALPMVPPPPGQRVPPSLAAPGKGLGPLAPGRLGPAPLPAPGGGYRDSPIPLAPGDAPEAPLPPDPADLQEPVALPPLPSPTPGETTRRWDRFWPTAGNARTQQATWNGLR
jgi:hypothetical protein